MLPELPPLELPELEAEPVEPPPVLPEELLELVDPACSVPPAQAPATKINTPTVNALRIMGHLVVGDYPGDPVKRVISGVTRSVNPLPIHWHGCYFIGVMAEKPVIRNELGQLSPGGGSLNPAGRPRGVPALIRELSHDGTGREPLEFLFAVMRGRVPKGKGWKAFTELPSTETRARCALKIWEHEVGKAPMSLRLSEGIEKSELEALSEAELDQLLLEQIAAKPGLREQALALLANGTEQ